MSDAFKRIDMFGVSFSFNTAGRSKHTTMTGAILTLFALSVIGLFTYLFGTDFFHKENPNLVESEILHLKSKKIAIPNDKYSFMMRIQDGASKPITDYAALPYKVSMQYFHYKKKGGDQFELMCNPGGSEFVTNCSNTKTKNNPALSTENLESWLCMDMEKVKASCREQLGGKEPNYEPILGGYNDEDEYSAIRFDVRNFEYDYKTKVYSNIAGDKEIEKLDLLVNMRYPNTSYDASLPEKPLRVFYDSQILLIRNNDFRRETRFFKIVTAIDDDGWVFPSLDTTSALAPDKTEVENSSSLFHSGLRVFYSCFFRNVKKEKIYNRSFMKLQELVAIVGGMIKTVVNLIMVYATYIALKERDELLLNKFYNIKVKGSPNSSEIPMQNETTLVNTVTKPRVSEDNQGKCSFWVYLMKFCRKSTDKARNVKILDQMRVYMTEKMDVIYLFKLFEQFSMMKDLLLTEDQKELLENKKTEIELEV